MQNPFRKYPKITEWLKAIGLSFVLVLVVRTFFFEISGIPSPSMERSLMTGDFIVINKLAYGPRLPRTILSIPFLQKKGYSDWISLPYCRLFGSPDVNRQDIVVFNYPMEDEYPVDHRTYFVKRCMAVAGDSIWIVSGEVFVNGERMEDSATVQYNYYVKTDSVFLDSAFLIQNGIYEGGPISEHHDYSYTLPQQLADSIAKLPFVHHMERTIEKSNMWDELVFPFNERYKWNTDYFGPLYIPKEGDTLHLDTTNLCFYSRLISVYENNTLEVKNGKVCINGDSSGVYVCRMNYFFMMGDNRSNSQDSRHWGFVPEDHIIGKASMVLYSTDRMLNKARWDRCLKSVK